MREYESSNLAIARDTARMGQKRTRKLRSQGEVVPGIGLVSGIAVNHTRDP
jgi:hypothetical protein